MNTTENNKLIAEFLGEKEQPYNFPQHGTLRLNGDFKTDFFENQLQFHKNWNWLMEVVEKIESFGYELQKNNNSVFLKGNYTSIEAYYSINKYYKTEFNKDCNLTFIEAVYSTCVEFIKWHNQQNK